MSAFCAIIERRLAVTKCPIPEAACVWRHRQSADCKYNPSSIPGTVAELATLVGAPVPSDLEIDGIKQAIKEAAIKELK